MRIARRAPDRLDLLERWSAVGRTIGEVRLYHGDRGGGQETTFGQDEVYAGASLDNARRDAAHPWLLEMRPLYRSWRVAGRDTIGSEKVWLLRAERGSGEPDEFAVSERTHLLLRRKHGGEVDLYSDFRSVGGCVIPFRTQIADALGDSEIEVQDVRLDEPLSDASFRPRRGYR